MTGLARLVADRSSLEQRWGREPLLTRAAELPAPFADLLDHEGVDELLSTRGLRIPFVRVAKGGRTLPERAFTRPGGVGATVADQVADDDLLRLFADGHTLVLQALHRTWAPVMRLVADLEDDLGHPVQANAYVTPPQSTGFAAHYDVHDVFVLQVAGEKSWRVHAPVHEHPLRDEPWDRRADAVAARAEEAPYLEATLRPGDCLYLPRGWLHAATALGGVSTHLTLGVHTWHGGHVLDALVDAARSRLAGDPALRASLPLGADPSDPTTYAAQLVSAREALRAALDDLDDAAVAAVLADRARQGRAAPVAPVRSVEDLALMSAAPEGWQVVLRPHLAAHLDDAGEGRARLVSRAGSVTVAPADRELVERLFAEDSLPVPTAGPDLARRLVVAGLAVLSRTTGT